MSRNNTGNPIGSKAFPDFEDNVKNLDEAVNTADPQWVDRFGRFRLPLMEQERQFVASQDSREDQFQSAQSYREAVFSDFLQGSGYQDLGEYAPGIEITAHNQYVTFGGQPYLLKPSIPVPYTTSGGWTGDDFKLIGDGSIRQDLANPDKGAAMVARGVMAVDSIADLLSLPVGQRREGLRYLVKGYHAGSDVGGGEFYWDSSRATENDGGLVFNGFARIFDGVVTPEMFGAFGDGVSDDTEALVAAANRAAEYPLVMHGQYRKDAGTSIVLPSGAKVDGTGTIKLLPHVETNYQIFRIQSVGDVAIRGITVDGNRDENSATGGEHGHGFDLRGTEGTVTLDTVTAINCWGDGIFIGSSGSQGSAHVKIINPYIANCRRQGISVIAVDRLDIDGGLIEDIGGTAPESGIDFEPNYETQKIRQVRITDLEIRDTAGPSITVVLTNVGLTEEFDTDIEITNLRTNRVINVSPINDMIKGRIFIDFTAKELTSRAFRSGGIKWPSTLDMTIRPRIHNHNMGNFSSGDGCALMMTNSNQDVDLRGPRIIDLIITEDAPRSTGVVFSEGSFKDTRIINPISAPMIAPHLHGNSLYPYEAVKLVGGEGIVKRPIRTATRDMSTTDFSSGVVEFTHDSNNGSWTLPAGTSRGTSSVIVFTSGGYLLNIYPPSGGNFVGLAVDERVVIPAQPGSGVKITPLGDDVFGVVPGFYSY